MDRSLIVDFTRRAGKIKPLVGANGGPLFGIDLDTDMTEVYRELSVPVIRVADIEPPCGSGRYLDIHNLFPDMSLDPRFPESYNFAPTDRYLTAAAKTGAEIILRLGESLDPYEIARYNHLPDDYTKYAMILERIIAHYNNGWGGGFKLRIKYIELWSAPDRRAGARCLPKEYYEFYRVVANYIKEKHPKIKVGGYSSGGFFALNHYGATREVGGYVPFLEGFLSYISRKETRAPLDFFTWEIEADTPEGLSLHTSYAQSYLSQYGFTRTESIISRLRLETRKDNIDSREYPALLAASLIIAEKSTVSRVILDTLDPRSKNNAIYSLDDHRTPHKYAAYEVLRAFGRLYSLGTAVETTDDFRRELYSLAAIGNEGGALLLVTKDYTGLVDISLSGSEFTTYSVIGVIGGGARGEGHSNSQENIPISKNRLRLRVGRDEVYFITLG